MVLPIGKLVFGFKISNLRDLKSLNDFCGIKLSNEQKIVRYKILVYNKSGINL